MIVKMITRAAGSLCAEIGEEVDVDDSVGQSLIDGGYATQVSSGAMLEQKPEALAVDDSVGHPRRASKK